MKLRKWYIVIGALVILFFIEVVWWVKSAQPESRVYNYPFSEVVAYLNYAFRTNVTSCVTTHSSVYAPLLLSTDTLYWIKTKTYVPGECLVFDAWFAQIGAEHNIFYIQNIGSSQTSISVNRKIKFIPFIFGREREREILNTIGNDMSRSNVAGGKNW